MADNLTTFMYQLSGNLGAPTSWKLQGLSRAVQGLLYLYTITVGERLSGSRIRRFPVSLSVHFQ